MSKIHDRKVNTDGKILSTTKKFSELLADEPMIDEEVEKALRDAMDQETPDLWNRIMAGIDAPDSPSGFDEFEGLTETVTDEGKPEVADNAANGEKSDAADNVVQFRSKTSEQDNAGDSHSKKESDRKAVIRKWSGLLVAAALIIVVSIPAAKVIFSQNRSQKESTSGNAPVTAQATEAEYVEEAAEGGYDAAMDTEAIESEDYIDSSNSMNTKSENSNRSQAGEAAATEAATEASAEAVAESTTQSINYGVETLGGKDTIIAEKWKIDTENIPEDKRNMYFAVSKYAGIYNLDIGKNVILYGLADATIEARVVTEDDEYYLTDCIEISIVDNEETEEYLDGTIKILNAEDSGITKLMNVEEYTEESRYRFSVKYPEKNNKNEVEIVEIFSME